MIDEQEQKKRSKDEGRKEHLPICLPCQHRNFEKTRKGKGAPKEKGAQVKAYM